MATLRLIAPSPSVCSVHVGNSKNKKSGRSKFCTVVIKKLNIKLMTSCNISMMRTGPPAINWIVTSNYELSKAASKHVLQC